MLLLRVAWSFFGVEVLLALGFALLFWYFWSRAGIQRKSAWKAISIYALGCIALLLIAISIPL